MAARLCAVRCNNELDSQRNIFMYLCINPRATKVIVVTLATKEGGIPPWILCIFCITRIHLISSYSALISEQNGVFGFKTR